jgi:hypothetical protein
MSSAGAIDYLDRSLPDAKIPMAQRDRITALEAQVERWDFALCAIERMLSLEIASGRELVGARMLLDTLGAAGQYGSCGLRGRTMDDLLSNLEAELGRLR